MLEIKWIIIMILLNQKSVAVKPKIECGYKQCPQTRDGALNVHLIPHSHMDAGWVKTFDEYYYGTRTTISTANVQLIFHSVLSELLHDKRRKFTFSETAYFWRWWKEQRPVTRATFRTLVQEGRVEFAGGGWVHNDEATPDYLHIIDQFTWGLRKINDTLGPCGKPKAAWQIDTYGHTREQASLLAQMGYDGLFVGRVDHKVRETMIEEDRMEFMWRGSDVLGKMSDIMTHTLFNLYNPPDGFCFDFLCNDEPIIDDPDNRVYNAEKRVNDFIVQIEKQAKYYDHDNIMVTMGGDFTYQSAANWFMNMDKLINHVNTHPANLSDINIFYSTPSCYLKALYLYGRRDKAVYTEKGDHIPYGSDTTTYWTGYYTSRPSLKYFARKAHIFLQVVKQLTVIARLGDSYELHLLRHAAALILHHDAITGTSQQHVTNDFIRTLYEAVDACTKKVSTLLSYLTPTWGGSRRPKNNQQFTICHQLNMSQCRFTETQESMLLLVYNPLSVKTYYYVKLPAVALHYTIRDASDEEVEYQLVPLSAATANLPGRSSTTVQELCFEAENIPPLGFSAYYISQVRDPLEENEYARKATQSPPDQEIIPNISNEYLKVTVNKTTGFLESIQHVDGVKIKLTQNFFYYSQSHQGQQSGAYSFRPEKDRPTPVTDRVTYHTVRGTLVKEIRQTFNDWVTQAIRLYRGEEFVEFEWIVGPIPVGSDYGKEVVSIFTTNITNQGEFFTDSNSRQMMRRTCWNETSTQQQKKPLASCYYPVSSRICIHSSNSSIEMCVLTDRTQGGTSYNEGEIELMIHRRLLTDDGFGLEEALNEEAFGVGLVIKGTHRIVFGNFRQEVDDQTFSERTAQAARRWLMEPWLFLTPGEKINRRKWQHIRTKRYSALQLHGLPRHISVLTLEPWKTGAVLLRLENTREKPSRGFRPDKTVNVEDFDMRSAHITVDLKKIFLQLQIKAVRETTLAANQWLDDARQMDWSTRYVYNGGDDGILPEDVDYGEDKPTKQTEQKDSVHYSDEEADDAQKRRTSEKRTEKTRARTKKPPSSYDEYEERKKRSINMTENIFENIINSTYDDIKTNKEDNFTTEAYNLTTSIDIEPTKTTTLSNITYASRTTEKYAHTKVTRPVTLTKKTPKLNYVKQKIRPTKFFAAWGEDSGDFEMSEEDFSLNLKKKTSARKKEHGSLKQHRQAETIDDTDDGITKSIYEMYYKTKQRKNPFKPTIKSSTEMYTVRPQYFRRKQKNRVKTKPVTEEVTDVSEHLRHISKNRNKRRGKTMTMDMPFFITEKERKHKNNKKDARGCMERTKEDISQNDREIAPERNTADLRSRKRKMVYADYTEPFEDSDGSEADEALDDRSRDNVRMKRTVTKEEEQPEAANSEPVEQSEQDFIITLRPTQIRTFVVWFENKKKGYTI